MKKKIILILIILILFISFFSYLFWFKKINNQEKIRDNITYQPEIKKSEVLAVETVELLEIEARGAISVLIRDNQPPQILFEKNIDEKLPIASLVKLMTAYVVLEYYDLLYEIEISEQAILQPETTGNLKKGQKLSIKDLLFPLLIESSNDAAFALAETIGQEKFVYLMNNEANRLGLKNTFFINSSGLDPLNPNKPINYSTIQDLVKFTKYLLDKDNNNLLWNILSTKEIELYGQRLVNTNQLLGEIPNIISGKTGLTVMAGGSLLLVLEAPDNNGYLINIILGAPTSESRFEEMRKLISYTYKLNR